MTRLFGTTPTILALYLFLLSLLLLPAAEASAVVSTSHNSHLYRIQHLHAVLNIGNDPNEDIRTNVALNMEGI
jgi:hypothetical protein